MNKYNLIFDFDSTLLKFETIEVLADIVLKKNKDRDNILCDIKDMTSLAMNGKMPFSKAFHKRISLLNIKQIHIDQTVEFLKENLTDSFYENIENFKNKKENCYIVSGGFKEIIIPLLSPYGFRIENIYANTFLKNKKDILMIDQSNILCKDKGKKLAADNISGKNIIIGDGYTDYELKKLGGAEIFILFIENIHRKKLDANADFIAKSFNDVFNYIDDEIQQ